MILEGVKSTHEKYFLKSAAEVREISLYLKTFGDAFEELNEFEKTEVLLEFKFELHSLIRPFLSRLPKKTQSEYEDKFKEAKANQIPCYFRCPKCNYEGATLQDGKQLLAHLTLRCKNCGKTFFITSVPLAWDKKLGKEFYA